MDSYDIFRQHASEICRLNNSFHLQDNEESVPELLGSVVLTDDNGQSIDTYQVKITCSSDYPNKFPRVYETGGRIPINIDWHVFPNGGHCCLCSVPNEMIACHNGITLQAFLDEFVRPYFFNQKHREVHGFFLKERSHGNLGNIEFFREIFGIENAREIAKCIMFIQTYDEPGRTRNCFCGSSKKYRHCHRAAFRLLKPLPVAMLDIFVKILLSS